MVCPVKLSSAGYCCIKSKIKRQKSNVPIALTIAGSDSSAGAGAQADLKTFTALGVYGLTAITCIVAETPGKVSRIQPADPEIVREQIELLLKNFPIAAIKTGLLCNAEIVAQVVRSLGKVKRNRLHLFGSDCGGIGEGCGAASCNRGCEENCFLRHSLSFRLEIWTRENLCPQPTSVAGRAKRCCVLPNRADDEGALNREIHSRAMRDPSPSARLRMTIRMA